MAKLVFSLRGVPDDEADEVRDLFNQHQISFYETSAGNWGVSTPALWLFHNDDFPKARRILDEYQQQRQISQRQLYLQQKQAGQQKTFLSVWREKPLLLLSYFAVMILIVYVSIRLLIELGLHF
jgi:hypothetical protein